MDRTESENLPPELRSVGERMIAERPVASRDALGRVMRRAAAVGEPRKSLLWRSTAPKARKKGVALTLAGVLAAAGMGGMAVAGAGAQDSTPEPPPPPATACPLPSDVFLVGVSAVIGQLLPQGTVVAVDVIVGNAVGVCVRIGGFQATNNPVFLGINVGDRIRIPRR